MEHNRRDEEQIDRLKTWWHEHGMAVVGGIVFGLSAVFGWRAWQDHLVAERQDASDLYQQLIDGDGDTHDPDGIANQLVEDYAATPYAEFAALLLAKQAAEKGDLNAADAHLRWILDHTGSDEFQHIARVRLGRLLLVQGNEEQALSLIDEAVDTGEFSGLYAEIRGDISLQQGDPDEARGAYLEALKKSSRTPSVVQTKVDDLGSE